MFALSSAANTDLAEIDSAIDASARSASTFGAVQNRFEHLMNGLSVYRRTSSRPSRASATWTWPTEMMTMTKYQILQQAGTSMLAQANQLPQSVLSLLRG